MPLPPATWPMARQLRAYLTMARAQGAEFDYAWQRTLALLVRDPDWREVFEETRETWRAAYERRPGPRELAALAVLVPDAPGFDQPAADTAERLCAWCDQPIRRLDPRARYCSVQHRRAAERAISRAREDRRRELAGRPPAAAASSAQTPTAMEDHRAA